MPTQKCSCRLLSRIASTTPPRKSSSAATTPLVSTTHLQYFCHAIRGLMVVWVGLSGIYAVSAIGRKMVGVGHKRERGTTAQEAAKFAERLAMASPHTIKQRQAAGAGVAVEAENTAPAGTGHFQNPKAYQDHVRFASLTLLCTRPTRHDTIWTG